MAATDQKGEELQVVEAEPTPASKRRLLTDVAFIVLKFGFAAVCLWYVTRSIDFSDLGKLAGTVNFPLAGFSVLMIMVQIPLIGIRWCKIVDALASDGTRVPRTPFLAITAIGLFFGQVAPNLVGDSVRVWMVARLGKPWRQGLISVLIDRGVGVGALLAIAFLVLLFPTGLAALGDSRIIVVSIFGAILAIALAVLFLAPVIAPVLSGWRATRLLGAFALASSDVLLRRSAGRKIITIAVVVHVFSIIAVWSLGHAQGFDLSVIDSAVLFAVMVGVSLVPITIGGWGLRELAMTSLLQLNGVSSERALLFSVSFGLVVFAASSVGAVVWAFYSPERTGSAA